MVLVTRLTAVLKLQISDSAIQGYFNSYVVAVTVDVGLGNVEV